LWPCTQGTMKPLPTFSGPLPSPPAFLSPPRPGLSLSIAAVCACVRVVFVCVYFHQALAPCCQNEATSIDCLANAAYMDFYDCRLLNDVGGDCTGLSCDAVGTAIIETTEDDDADADADTDDAAEEDDLETTSESGAGLVAPSSLTGGISAVFVVAGLSAGVMRML